MDRIFGDGPAGAAVVAAILWAIGITAAQGAQGSAEDGRRLAERLCSGCHAVGASPADSPHANAPRFTEIARKWPPDDLAEALAEGIEVGHRGEGIKMPQFTLEPTDIDALIAYLEVLRTARP